MEGTRATGSPVGVQGASAAEWWSTYEGLDAEYASKAEEADRCWSAYEEASRVQRESWDAAHAAYQAWWSAAVLGGE